MVALILQGDNVADVAMRAHHLLSSLHLTMLHVWHQGIMDQSY